MRFLSLFLIGFFVFSGCALDYNNYPYAAEESASQAVVVPPAETTIEEPTPAVSESSTEIVPVVLPEEPSSETVAPVEQPAAYVPQTQIFTVTASQFSFSPSTITVNKGDTVVINFSVTDVPHGFGLPDFNINLVGEPGKEVTGSFVADKAGTFPFRCTIVCGSGHSTMTGTFVVNDV